jgi:hypothetical protein
MSSRDSRLQNVRLETRIYWLQPRWNHKPAGPLRVKDDITKWRTVAYKKCSMTPSGQALLLTQENKEASRAHPECGTLQERVTGG